MTNKRLDNNELIKFIKTYGREAHGGSRRRIDKELNWFLAKNRAFIVKDKNKSIKIILTFVISKDLEFIKKNKWPEDNPKGKYLFGFYMVVHPKLRVKNFFISPFKIIKNEYPNLKYFAYLRGHKNNKLQILDIDKFIKKGG